MKKLELKAKETGNDIPNVKITSSEDCVHVIRKFYNDDIEIFESFFILLLNKSNKTIAWTKISQGGVSGTVVDIKIIAKYAIDVLASAIILCHNHPSGNLNPSEADKEITKKTIQALKLFDIVVLDHIILTKKSYFSFGDQGLI